MAGPQGVDEGDTITVVGVGSVDVEPDRLRLQVAVSTVAPTVAEALSEAAAAQRRMIDVLVDGGLGRRSMQTTGYHAGPDHGAPQGSTRQRVDVSLSVVLPGVDDAGDLLARLSEAAGPGFRVDGLSLEIADPEPHRRVARADAVAAARRTAEELAAAAGVRLGRLRSLVDGAAPMPMPMPMSGRLMASSAPGIEGGEIGIRLVVTATYEIVG
jgi:uncharacterized protein YggE